MVASITEIVWRFTICIIFQFQCLMIVLQVRL